MTDRAFELAAHTSIKPFEDLLLIRTVEHEWHAIQSPDPQERRLAAILNIPLYRCYRMPELRADFQLVVVWDDNIVAGVSNGVHVLTKRLFTNEPIALHASYELSRVVRHLISRI